MWAPRAGWSNTDAAQHRSCRRKINPTTQWLLWTDKAGLEINEKDEVRPAGKNALSAYGFGEYLSWASGLRAPTR